MGVLNVVNFKIYDEGWKQVGEAEAFDAEDLALLSEEALVVKSTYGMSFKMPLKQGGSMYLPISSKESSVAVDDHVKMENIRVIKLEKQGCKPIFRGIVEIDRPIESVSVVDNSSFDL